MRRDAHRRGAHRSWQPHAAKSLTLVSRRRPFAGMGHTHPRWSADELLAEEPRGEKIHRGRHDVVARGSAQVGQVLLPARGGRASTWPGSGIVWRGGGSAGPTVRCGREAEVVIGPRWPHKGPREPEGVPWDACS